MKFSFIIPTYKPNKGYMNECLLSIAGLTIPTNAFEILIVLNGPKYPYYDMLESIIDKEVVKLIYTDVKGVSNARNLGLDNARGTYLIFVDDDDWISNDFIDVNFLENNKSCIAVSNVKSYLESENSLINEKLTIAFNKRLNEKFDLLKFRCFLSQVCGKIFPREIIGNVRFDTTLSISEDALFMFEISNKIKMMHLNKKATYFRRVRKDSASNTKKSLGKIFSNMMKFIIALSKIYIKSPRGYNFSLYVSRILAAVKYFLIKIKQ